MAQGKPCRGERGISILVPTNSKVTIVANVWVWAEFVVALTSQCERLLATRGFIENLLS